MVDSGIIRDPENYKDMIAKLERNYATSKAAVLGGKSETEALADARKAIHERGAHTPSEPLTSHEVLKQEQLPATKEARAQVASDLARQALQMRGGTAAPAA